MDKGGFARLSDNIIVEKKHGIAHSSATHFHESFEIALFEHCDVRVFCQNRWFDLHDGDVFYIPKNMIHRYEYLNTEQYSRVVIEYMSSYLAPSLCALGCEDLLTHDIMGQCHKLSPTRTIFLQLMREADKLAEAYKATQETRAPLEDGILRARLAGFLYEILSLCKTHNMHELRSKSNAYVQSAIRQIDEMYMESLTLDEIAAPLHIDKYYLCHIFRQHVGLTIVQYLQYRRIIEAQKIMLYNPHPIAVISDMCGFGSLQQFYQVFRKVTGCSPLQYLKSASSS